MCEQTENIMNQATELTPTPDLTLCTDCKKRPIKKNSQYCLCETCYFKHHKRKDLLDFKNVINNATCPICGKIFVKKIWNAIFCSTKCKEKHDNKQYSYRNKTYRDSHKDRNKKPGAQKGIPSWNKGIPMSDAAKQKLSETRLKLSEEGKITPWNKGKEMSEEYCKINSECHMGQAAWNKVDNDVTCSQCGKVFHKKPSFMKGQEHHFCSHRCKALYQEKSYWGINNPFFGKKHPNAGIPLSEELKQRISKSHIKRIMENPNPVRGRIRWIYNGIGMRSKWECYFAYWLDKQYLNWKYEKQIFYCGNLGTYSPDFYVEEWDKYIEIKGHPYPKSMQKFNFVSDRYPGLFELWDEDRLKNEGVFKDLEDIKISKHGEEGLVELPRIFW